MEIKTSMQAILKRFINRANDFYSKNEPKNLDQEFVFSLIRYAWSGVLNFNADFDLVQIQNAQIPSNNLFVELEFFNGYFYSNGETVTIGEFIIGKKLDLIHFDLPNLFFQAIYQKALSKKIEI